MRLYRGLRIERRGQHLRSCHDERIEIHFVIIGEEVSVRLHGTNVKHLQHEHSFVLIFPLAFHRVRSGCCCMCVCARARAQ